MKEKLRKRIIELVHGLPYAEAIKKEHRALNSGRGGIDLAPFNDYDPHFYGHITMGRVIRALNNKIFPTGLVKERDAGDLSDHFTESLIGIVHNWLSTKENGQESTLDDQNDKTIETIYNLLK